MTVVVSKKKVGKCTVVLAVLGIATVILGIVTAALRLPQKIVDLNFREHLIINMDSPTFHDWVLPPTPVYMDYYIFNVTNADDVIEGAKPKVEECGPYSYAMSLPRFDVAFYVNKTVGYRFNHTLHFQKDRSNGSENDIIYHLNMPLVTINLIMEKLSISGIYADIFAELVDLVGEKDLFVPHTAKEILFGYVDPFFQFLHELLGTVGVEYDPVFAPFHNFNNSDDGLYLIETGEADYTQTNKIQRWNGEAKVPYWTTDYANMINGTDGSFFRPYVKREETRYMFFSDVCRSLKLDYQEDTSVKGVGTLRFHFADDNFANVTVHPDNEGYCVPAGNCYDSGVLNVAECRQGAPALLSLPHFYNAAPAYQNAVEGLTPLDEIHDSVFDVEPISGVVFYSSRKIQINMEVKQSKYITQLKNVTPIIFPVLWLGGDATMPDDVSKQFRGIKTLVSFMNVIAYVVITLGLLTIAIGAFLHYRRSKAKRGELTPLLQNSRSYDD